MTIRQWLSSHLDSTTQIHVGHRYTDTITGELFDVTSVGSLTQIERYDADRRPDNSVKTETLRRAIDEGIVVHDEDRCPECL